MANEINVLITAAGSLVMPEIIELIRQNGAVKNIVTIDSRDKELCVGSVFSDVFLNSPRGNDPSYPKFIEKVIVEHNISVVFPLSDEEAYALSSVKKHFESEYNCKVIVEDKFIVNLVINKLSLTKYLESRGVKVPVYAEVDSFEDIESFANKIGYPESCFIIKPIIGRGSKGVKLITAEEKNLFESSSSFKASLDELRDYFSNGKEDEISNYFVSEYLSGEKFSTNVLNRNNLEIDRITRSNGVNLKHSPPTKIASIIENKDVNSYVDSIMSILNHEYCLQIETGYSSEGEILLIEVNPRLDATVMIFAANNRNIYSDLISLALRNNIPSTKARNKEKKIFYRYYKSIIFNG